jgi:hypothetical protein
MMKVNWGARFFTRTAEEHAVRFRTTGRWQKRTYGAVQNERQMPAEEHAVRFRTTGRCPQKNMRCGSERKADARRRTCGAVQNDRQMAEENIGCGSMSVYNSPP